MILERSVGPDRMLRRLVGRGIEIGAFQAPQFLPDGEVRYVDLLTRDDALRYFPEVSQAVPVIEPDILASADDLAGIPTGSQDFVVASHLLEHVEDPMKALAEWHRVLCTDGMVYLCLPDMRNTFDRERQRTTLEHLIEDHRASAESDGLQRRNKEHYVDWARHVNGLEDEAQAEFWADLLQMARFPIHFHCWTPPDIEDLLRWLAEHGGPVLEILDRQVMRKGYEFAFLLAARSS